MAIELWNSENESLVHTMTTQSINNGIYEWEIPHFSIVPGSENYKVRIYDPENPSVYDESNGVFRIHDDPQYYLRITSPEGGETWQMGTVHNISWISENFTDNTENITLDLYRNGLFEGLISNVNNGITIGLYQI